VGATHCTFLPGPLAGNFTGALRLLAGPGPRVHSGFRLVFCSTARCKRHRDPTANRYIARKCPYIFGIARRNFSAQIAQRLSAGECVGCYPAPRFCFCPGGDRAELVYVAAALRLLACSWTTARLSWERPSPLRRSYPSQLSAGLRSSIWLNKIRTFRGRPSCSCAIRHASHLFGEVRASEPDKSGANAGIGLGIIPTKLLIAVFLQTKPRLGYRFFREPRDCRLSTAGALWLCLTRRFLEAPPLHDWQMRLFLWGLECCRTPRHPGTPHPFAP